MPSDELDPRVHIGKRIGPRESDNKCGFLFAQHRAYVFNVCKTYPESKVAKDGSGREYTGHELNALIDECVLRDQIGVRFC